MAHEGSQFCKNLALPDFRILERGREVDLAMWKQVHNKEAKVDNTAAAKNVRMNARKKDVGEASIYLKPKACGERKDF